MMPKNFTGMAIVLCAISWSHTLTAQESVTGEFLIEDHSATSSISEEDPEDLDWRTTPTEGASSGSPSTASGGDGGGSGDWGGIGGGGVFGGGGGIGSGGSIGGGGVFGGGGGIGGGGSEGSWADALPSQNGDFMEGEATRIFAGPSQFPPEKFGAYAILAFKSNPVQSELSRYLMICEAYRTSIPDAAYVMLPEEQQLVTVWPVISDEAAEKITVQEEEEKCSVAVHNYGLRTALAAIRHARMINKKLAMDLAQKRGPFLLAWNPSSDKGREDALILRMDLSNVDMPHQAKRRMEFWVQQIEMHPESWVNGWQPQTYREVVSDLADSLGEEIIAFFGPIDQ